MLDLTKAIVTKAASSTFLNSVSSRFENGIAGQFSDFPYCVFKLPVTYDPQTLSTFDRTYEDIVMDFDIFSSLYSPSEAWTIWGYLNTLYDACTLSITGHTLIKMEHINTTYIPEEHSVPDKTGTTRVHHIAAQYRIVTKVG